MNMKKFKDVYYETTDIDGELRVGDEVEYDGVLYKIKSISGDDISLLNPLKTRSPKNGQLVVGKSDINAVQGELIPRNTDTTPQYKKRKVRSDINTSRKRDSEQTSLF